MSSPEHRIIREEAVSSGTIAIEPLLSVTERERSIDIARMAAAFLIVLYHSSESYSMSGGGPIFGRPLWSVVGDFSLWGRVPFFFFLSGCFAARSLQKHPDATGSFLKKRLSALVPPYLFWNLVSFSMLWLAARAGVQAAQDGRADLAAAAEQIVGIGMAPANGPLWFVRDLILCSCLAPLLKRFGPWLLVPCVALTIIPEIPDAWISQGCPRPSSLGYFGIGMLLSYVPRGTMDLVFPKPGLGLLLCLLLGLVHSSFGLPKPSLAGVACGALGILLLGRYVDSAWPKLADWLGRNANASFMIFAANVPFFAVARGIYPRLPSGIPPLVYYWGLAVIFVFAAIAAHLMIKRFFPKLLFVVSGGR
jgi:peptidoglycan/LPS O-acetylase OafA/YrhL